MISFTQSAPSEGVKTIKIYSNASQDFQVFLAENLQEKLQLTFSEDIEINKIEISIQQLLSTSQTPGFLFFENYPNESFQLVRCIKRNKENQYFRNLSEIDKLNDEFESYFHKKSFIMNHLETIQNFGQDPHVIGQFQCKGLLLQDNTKKMSKYLQIRDRISIQLTAFLKQELMLPKKESLIFTVNPQNYFTATIYLHNAEVQSLGFVQNFADKKQFQKKKSPLMFQERLFTQIKDHNKLHFIHKKKTNQTTIYFNERSNFQLPKQMLSITEKVPFNINYRAQFHKTLLGSGLHQEIAFQFKLNISKQYLSNEYISNNCEILLLDFLEDNQYIDLEEFREMSDNFGLRLEKIIDIEHPSFNSTQHLYLITYKIASNNQAEKPNLFIDLNFKYPIHFRYRTPIKSSLYKTSNIYPHTKIYFNCFNFQTQQKLKASTSKNFYTNFIHNQVSFAYYEIQAQNKSEINLANVPVGNTNKNFYITAITFMMNFVAAGLISILVLTRVQYSKKSLSKVK